MYSKLSIIINVKWVIIMNKYKIVFIDIDGTLRNSLSEIPKEVKNKIHDLIEKGIKVVLCTGRSRKYAAKVAKEVGTSDYVISSNGAEVTNLKTGEIVFNYPINRDIAEEIFNYCKKSNINMLINTVDNDYQTIEESSNRDYIEDIAKVKEDINQIVLTSMSYNKMLVIPRMFKDKYPRLKLNSSSNDLNNPYKKPIKDYYYDYNYDDVSKAKGIVELLDYLHISKEDSVSIGDSYNDIAMCELTGYCVAMGNAIDALKVVANEVTKTNDENGVATFIDSLL